MNPESKILPFRVSFEVAKMLKSAGYPQKECISYLLVDFSETNNLKVNPNNLGIGDWIGFWVPNKSVNAVPILEVLHWFADTKGYFVQYTYNTSKKHSFKIFRTRDSQLVYRESTHETLTEAYNTAFKCIMIFFNEPFPNQQLPKTPEKMENSQPNINQIPRRNDFTRLTKSEKAILKAMYAVDELPADEKLTEAIVLLQQAKYIVADYIDNHQEELTKEFQNKS